MFNFLNDDKNLVIVAVTVLGLTLLLYAGDLSPEKANILNSLFSGLFGIAVGRATKD